MKSVFVAIFAVLLLGCASKDEVQKLQSENARLRLQVSQLQTQVDQANRFLHETKAQLARKPAMPVQIAFRKALMGAGHVAVISTTIKQDFPAIVEFKSKSLGVTKKFQVNLYQSRPSEIGHSEGATIYPGDQIIVQNEQFESVSATCPPM